MQLAAVTNLTGYRVFFYPWKGGNDSGAYVWETKCSFAVVAVVKNSASLLGCTSYEFCKSRFLYSKYSGKLAEHSIYTAATILVEKACHSPNS